MAQYATLITFDPQPRKIGLEWHVVATYPAGHIEHVMGFHGEGEALDWLASESSQTWLIERGYVK